METWFLCALILSSCTDVLDGYLARKLNLITPLGAHFDNWPFMLASFLFVVAGVEEILITFILREERTNVRSIRAVLNKERWNNMWR